MLVTFTTENYADITMFEDIALVMLKMMGHSGTVPSAISAEQVPDALRRLTEAIDAEKASLPMQGNYADEQAVSLSTRAHPLINLLSAAVNENAFVMWR